MGLDLAEEGGYACAWSVGTKRSRWCCRRCLQTAELAHVAAQGPRDFDFLPHREIWPDFSEGAPGDVVHDDEVVPFLLDDAPDTWDGDGRRGEDEVESVGFAGIRAGLVDVLRYFGDCVGGKHEDGSV